jgi:hypothetical protein
MGTDLIPPDLYRELLGGHGRYMAANNQWGKSKFNVYVERVIRAGIAALDGTKD